MLDSKYNERIDNIQALRFVAAALVLITHITFYINSRLDARFSIWSPGAAGVSLFFVISGVVIYLSAASLQRNGTSAGNFLRRRGLRIFPLYWVVTTAKILLALALPAALVKNQPDLLYAIGSYFLIPMTNAAGKVEPLHGVGWSLLHEMYFYYIFSLALVLRVSPYKFCALFIGLMCAIGLVVPAETALAKVCFSEQNLLFVAGMILAHVFRKGFRIGQTLALLIFALGLGLMLSETLRNMWYPIFRRFDIGAILIVMAALSIRFTVFQALQRIFVRLGDSSYSLYLMHPILAPTISLAMWKMHFASLPVILFLTFIICVAAGHAVFLYVESPLNRHARAAINSAFSKNLAPA